MDTDIDFNKYEVIIVGCGLSGAVIAEQYAKVMNKEVLVIDRRDHIGGNCYDYIDTDTQILCNKYGPHYFHTNDEEVWAYIQNFAEWVRHEHKVVGSSDGKLFPIPVNINTINILCGTHIQTSAEMDIWLSQNQIHSINIQTGEDMALSRVGKDLYEKIFKYYTYKQWAKYPSELAPEILARLPIRNNFDDRYFTDKYQVLPKDGYTAFFNKLLSHPKITVRLNVDYFAVKSAIPMDKITIYTGPIDRYFADTGHEKLEYRSLDIVFETHKDRNFYQTHAQVNYPNLDTAYTRIIEYKHNNNQRSPHTIISREYSSGIGEPYYPVINQRNLDLFEKYKIMAEHETITRNIHFIGRLANYKYFNMDQAIKNSLKYFKDVLVKLM